MAAEPNQETKADEIADTVQKLGTAGSFYSLAKTIGFSVLIILFAVFLLYIGVPVYICAGLIFIAGLLIVLDIIRVKRILGVDLRSLNEPEEEVVDLEPDEILMNTIPAVMQYGKVRSYEVLGAGKVITPANALIITNKAVWVLTVPLAGVDKIVSGTDIGKWQWTVAYQDIIDILNKMISTLPLDEVFKQCRAKRLLLLKEISSAKTLPFTQAISLKKLDGKKFGYSVRLKEDYLKAKKIFKIN